MEQKQEQDGAGESDEGWHAVLPSAAPGETCGLGASARSPEFHPGSEHGWVDNREPRCCCRNPRGREERGSLLVYDSHQPAGYLSWGPCVYAVVLSNCVGREEMDAK